MTDGELLRAARERAGLSQAELARRIGKSTSYLGHLETGLRQITPDLELAIISELGDFRAGAPMERSVEIGRVTKDIPVDADLTIPLHWQTVPAGNLAPIVTESFDEFNVTKRYANTFAVYIRGDSMIGAGIEDADIAVFRENLAPRPGQVVYACVNNLCTVKCFMPQKDGTVVLAPANELYDPIVVGTDDSLTIRGVLINVIREPKPYTPRKGES